MPLIYQSKAERAERQKTKALKALKALKAKALKTKALKTLKTRRGSNVMSGLKGGSKNKGDKSKKQNTKMGGKRGGIGIKK